MGDKQRRDYGSGSISQRKDGTWTARMIIGTNEAGKPRIKAFYGKSEREVKKKMKEFEKELHKNDGTVVQKNTVETYMLAFAEYERGMIVERTQTGKAVARQDPSFKDGRPKKFTPEQIALALSLLEQGKTYRQITTMTGISKSTLIRAKRVS